MKKDFDTWNGEKKYIHVYEKNRLYHERDIWFCSLGTNVGFEQDGTGTNFDRPVVIIKGFNAEICFVVALTGRKRESTYYRYLGIIDGRDSSAILSQVRLVDTKRLVHKIGVLNKNTFAILKNDLARVLLGK